MTLLYEILVGCFRVLNLNAIYVQADVEKNLKNKRVEALEQMKTHASDLKDVEKDIYTVGHRLKTVLEENDRFMQVSHIQMIRFCAQKNFYNFL